MLRGRSSVACFSFIVVVIGACRASRSNVSAPDDVSRSLTGEEQVDLLAARCARIASCAHPHDPPPFRDPVACVEHWLEQLNDKADPIPACLTTARACGEIDTCLHGPGSDRAAAYCTLHPEVSTACDGNARIACVKDDPSESTLTLCRPGSTCGEVRTAGGLVERACLSPATCPNNAHTTRCDGPTTVVACQNEVEDRTPCPTGTTCHAHMDEDGEELATCEGPVELACDPVGARSCRGAVLVRCEAHGHHGKEESVDCAALGMACGVVSGRAACVVAPAPSGPCETKASRCDKDAIVFCAAGKQERIACQDLGLGPCETEGTGPVALCGTGRVKPPRR